MNYIWAKLPRRRGKVFVLIDHKVDREMNRIKFSADMVRKIGTWLDSLGEQDDQVIEQLNLLIRVRRDEVTAKLEQQISWEEIAWQFLITRIEGLERRDAERYGSLLQDYYFASLSRLET